MEEKNENKPDEEQEKEESFLKQKMDAIEESFDKKKEEISESLEKKKEEFSESIDKMEENLSKSIDTGVKKTKSFFRKLVLGGLLLAVVAGIGYLLYANYTYSEGTRAGDLIKISRKGYVFKTYEGQLKLGGIDLQNTEEGLSDTWSFSVKNKEIVQQLEKMQGQKVILRYKEINQAMPWQGDTNYFIYAVEKQ